MDPPFFQELLPTELPQVFKGPTRWLAWLDDIFENLGATIERRRRTGTSRFKEDHFKDAAKLAAQLRPRQEQDELSKFLYGKLSPETQFLVRPGGQPDLARALAKDFNRIWKGRPFMPPGGSKHQAAAADPEGGAGRQLTTNTTVRLNRRMLEEAYPDAIVKSLGGVYPDTEIHTATYEELVECEQVTPRSGPPVHARPGPSRQAAQLKPGEDVRTATEAGFPSAGSWW